MGCDLPAANFEQRFSGRVNAQVRGKRHIAFYRPGESFKRAEAARAERDGEG